MFIKLSRDMKDIYICNIYTHSNVYVEYTYILIYILEEPIRIAKCENCNMWDKKYADWN